MSTALRRFTALALTLAVAGAPLRASAQTPPPAAPATPADDAVAQASAHYARGVKLYQEDDFRAAFIEFTRAYELAPNWAVLYNIGQSQYQLRDYPTALATLEKYVQEGGEKIAPERRAEVDREIGELRGRVARVTMLSNVDGTDIALDDAPVVKTPVSQPLVVGAGRHRFSASRSGYLTTTRTVDIAGGDTLTIHLDLQPEIVAPPPVREHASYTVAVVGGVFALAGIATGTVFGVLAMKDKSSLDSECTSAKVCPSSAQHDIDAFSRDGAVSTVAFGVGAAGLLVGGYFFFHELGKDTASGPPRQATFTPWVGPGAGGVAGTF